MKKPQKLEKITKSMDYRVRKFSSVYLFSLTKLIDASFSVENKDKVGLVQWKYFDEYLNDNSITYIALDQTNNVVSHYTNVPVSISFGDNIYRSMICTDMCTSPGFRGKGLISKLSAKVYREVIANKYDFSLGFSNDEGIKIDKYAKGYGYSIVGKFVRYFKIVTYRTNAQYKLLKISNFNRDFYPQASKFFKVKKDYEYLNWRYVSKPNSEYEIYGILENDSNIGYIVLLFIKYKCYVCDIIIQNDDKSQMIQVLRSIENIALDRKVRLIIYNVLDNKFWKSLFSKYKYLKKENNNTNYYLTIKSHNEKIPKELILNKNMWIVMNGDIL